MLSTTTPTNVITNPIASVSSFMNGPSVQQTGDIFNTLLTQPSVASVNTFPAAGPSAANMSATFAQSALLGALPSGTPETINAILLSLLGKTDTFTQQSSDIDHGVPDRVRVQIWSNKYIDFVQLLRINSAAAEPVLFKVPKGKPDKMHTYMGWTKAFHIFQVIYCQKFPEQNIPLIKYEETIRDLYQRAPNAFGWREYDERFRFRRQSTLAPWEVRDAELWLNVAPQQNRNGGGSNWQGSSTSFSQPFRSYNNNNGNSYQKSGKDFKKSSGGKFQPLFDKCKNKGVCF